MDILNLIISLVSGAVGGNVAGAAVSDKNLGPIANSIIGLIGGGAGNFILKAMGVLASTGVEGGGGFDISSLLATIAASGVSGGALTAIVSFIKAAMKK